MLRLSLSRLQSAASGHSRFMAARLSSSTRTFTKSRAFANEGALHVIGGAAVFVAAERGTAYALEASGVRLPSSVTALCVLGATVAVAPPLGVLLQRALGPATVWMRSWLAVALIPAFLFPAVAVLPEVEALPKLAVLAVGGVVLTLTLTGHGAAALMCGTVASVPVACAASIASAGVLFSSVHFGAVALLMGGGLAAMFTLYGAAPPGVTMTDAQARAPGYLGATVALYVAAARLLPASVRTFCPPNVGCALLLLPLLLCAGGGTAGTYADEVRTYLDGAGAYLLASVQPCMVTLGLYAHTHRTMLRQQRVAILALAFVAAPLTLFATAYAGRAMDVAPEHVASLLPASTTTGLALTMPSGMPLIREEWVAAGTAFNSGAVQVSLPLLLSATMLTTPFSRGIGVGCTAHVGGMVALIAAGEVAAADACAVALVVCGVARAVLVQIPVVGQALTHACGGDDDAACVVGTVGTAGDAGNAGTAGTVCTVPAAAAAAAAADGAS